MTPKEKAEELISKYELVERSHRYQDELNLFEAKQCALICVDEIINTDILIPGNWHEVKETARLGYWEDVKEEIKKL